VGLYQVHLVKLDPGKSVVIRTLQFHLCRAVMLVDRHLSDISEIGYILPESNTNEQQIKIVGTPCRSRLATGM